jgi:hypothetical protein
MKELHSATLTEIKKKFCNLKNPVPFWIMKVSN